MRVHVSDPDLVDDLLRFLHRRIDVVAAQVAPDALEVSLLGSRALPAARMELELRLRAWAASRPGARAELGADD
jgi:hypothetical protein